MFGSVFGRSKTKINENNTNGTNNQNKDLPNENDSTVKMSPFVYVDDKDIQDIQRPFGHTSRMTSLNPIEGVPFESTSSYDQSNFGSNHSISYSTQETYINSTINRIDQFLKEPNYNFNLERSVIREMLSY